MRVGSTMIAIFVCHSLIAHGYGVLTHSDMSDAAIKNSKTLADSSILKEWGIDGSFDSVAYPRASDLASRTILELITIDGARSEDDFPRPINHFFDPFYGKPLLWCEGALPNQSSPDWAIDGTGQSDPSDYSFARARRAMKEAFTADTNEKRDKAFGLMFESVGHVIHHIQDMAQPQHVRNDAHLELLGLKYMEIPLLENKSRYEDFTEGAAGNGLPLNGYQNVRLKSPRDYWTNSSGTGLAQYTNGNFVSQGANFQMLNGAVSPNAKYPMPVPIDVTQENIKDILRSDGSCPSPSDVNRHPTSPDQRCSLSGEIDFVYNPVIDALNPGDTDYNWRAAAYSIFNQDLEINHVTLNQVNTCGVTVSINDKIFTVNRLTFPSAWEFLIPRAVGYSAGMIDYFFRGKIDLVLSAANDGTFDFKNLGDEALKGTVKLYYDAEDGKRYPVQGGSWDVDLAANATKTGVTIEESTTPPPKKAGVYMMVFTGTMGEEKPIGDGPGAVIAKLVKLPLPEFYWGYNSVGPHGEGQFELSFKLPSQLDPFFQQNFANVHIKVNGTDYPQINQPHSGCVLPGMPPELETRSDAGDGSSSSWVSWVARYYSNNQVEYDNLADGFIIYGSADQFQQIRASNINYIPFCANQFNIGLFPAYQNVNVEYFLGSKSIMKLCARLEKQIGVEQPDFTNLTLVLSRITGARVADGAASIRWESPAASSCPGY